MKLNELFEIQDVLDNKIYDRFPELKNQDNIDWKILALQVELGELANEWRGFKKWSNRQTPIVEQERCDYCGEDVDYTRPSPFMGDIGASMCKPCWNMTKEEYAASNGEHIPRFEDYPHFKKKEPKKLLEEYVDCLHFILSIGLEIGCTPAAVDLISKEVDRDITKQFIGLFDVVSSVRHNAEYFGKNKSVDSYLYKSYHKMFSVFLGLGQMLGFTWEQIESAYLEKNKINHERQENGY